jgi:hypothetical protein
MAVKNFMVYIKTNFGVDAQKLVKYYDDNNCELVQQFPVTRVQFVSSKSSTEQQVRIPENNPHNFNPNDDQFTVKSAAKHYKKPQRHYSSVNKVISNKKSFILIVY